MAIWISNVPETSFDECEGFCPSWIQHWERATGLVAEKCSVVGCHEYDIDHLVGAHVYREDDEDEDDIEYDTEYIIPLCKVHNHHTQDLLEVRNNTKFVLAEELETCPGEDEE